MRWLAILLLVIWAGVASAQTNAPLPSSTSETTATLGFGQIVLQLDNPTGFQQGQTVQVTSQTDQQSAIGTIVTWDPVLFNATINITTPNLQGNVYFSFFVQVLASAGNQVGIHPDLTAVSNTPYNGVVLTPASNTPSSLKMTVSLPGSLAGGSSIPAVLAQTLVAGNVYPFTVTTTQYFPIQGHIQVDDLTPGVHNHYNATVFSYSGNTLNLLINAVFGTGSPSSTWGLYGVAGPETRISFYQMNGLNLLTPGAPFHYPVFLKAGSARDSSDTVDLVLAAMAEIDFGTGGVAIAPTSVVQTGTISSSGNAVTGTGTAFTKNFSANATLTDFNNQLTNANAATVSHPSLISAGGLVVATTAVTDDTHLTTDEALGVSGAAFGRGGQMTPALQTVGQTYHYGVGICMLTTTGVVTAFATSFTVSGNPDLPANCGYYRILWDVALTIAGGNTASITAVCAMGPVTSCFKTSNTLGGDVNLNNVANYFDGPSMAQGTSGTWSVSGSVSVTDTAGIATINCKLWDGASIISSGRSRVNAANSSETISLSGQLTSPTGNIRISCNDPTSTSGKIQFNASGNRADANIWGFRIQ